MRQPPERQPVVHHEPGSDDTRPPGDSPWRRTQRSARPDAHDWQPGRPAQARHGDDRPYPGDDQFYPRDQYGDQAGSEDDDEPARFVPGFGYGSGDDADDDQPEPVGHRAPRRVRPAAREDGAAEDGVHGGGAPPGGRRPRRRRRARWIAPLVALLVILIPLGVGGYFALTLYLGQYHPDDFSGDGTGRVVVQVTSGDTPTSLGPKLVQDGVLASSRAFVLAAEHSSSQSGLVPGFYALHKQMKASLAYAQLINPKNLIEIKVTIPEGWRLSQIISFLGAKSGISKAAYDQVIQNPAQLDLPVAANGKPEGYLFPATYDILPHETALSVLKNMVARFDQEAASVNLPSAASQVHLSPSQVITMASLVEAEGGRLSDYPKIARVIYNRLARKMPLQLDSTVLYGLNKYGIIASDQQLTSTSRYNTYKYPGLTPGPIDSPGDAAIKAVLHPAAGSWVYFVTVNPKTGETLFTSSEAQFEQYRQQLEKNLGQG